MDSEHGSRCFPCRWCSICRWFRPNKLAQDSKEPLSVADVEKKVDIDIQPETSQSSAPDDDRQPEANFEATEKTIETLKSVAGVTGVSLLDEVLGTGLHVIDLCEPINEQAIELRNRVAEYLLVVTQFMRKPKDNPIADEMDSFFQPLLTNREADVNNLKKCLDSINERLERIKNQMASASDFNIPEIEHCVALLKGAIDNSQTLRGLRAATDPSKIQSQLEKLQSELQTVAQEVLKARIQLPDIGPVALMPDPPSIFYGRTKVVDKIAGMLTTRQQNNKFPRICLSGPGGFGKTSTALAVMRHESVQRVFGNRQFWVDCTGAPSPGALLGVLAKSVGLTQQSNDVEAGIFARFAASDPGIILFDNVETLWSDTDTRSAIEKLLKQFDALPHVAILLTVRSEHPPPGQWHIEKLAAVSPLDARKIYAAIRRGAISASPSDTKIGSDPDLDKLLDSVGHIPYAVSLLATLARRSPATPTQLLREWQSAGITVGDPMDRCIAFLVKSSFIQNCEGAEDLLRVLSMLPAGTPRSHLQLWFSLESSLSAISALRDAAMITVGPGDDPTLSALPVVQSYMQKDIPLSLHEQIYDACFKLLLDHEITFSGPNTSTFKDHRDFLALEERNIEALLARVMEAAIATTEQAKSLAADQMRAFQVFVWYQYWTKPRVELAEKLVQAAELANDNSAKAKALLSLGRMLDKLSRYMDARDKLLQARELFLNLQNDGSKEDQAGHRRSAVLCALFLNQLDLYLKPASSNTIISLQQLQQQCEGDEYLEALRLQCMGTLQWAKHQHDDALKLLSASQKLFVRNGCPFDAAQSLMLMSRSLTQLSRHEDALKALDGAIETLRRLRFEGYLAFLLKVRTLKSLGRLDNTVLESLNLALRYSQREGRPLAQAQVLEECGEMYVKQEDWQAATLAYEEASKATLQINYAKTRQLIPERCAQNLTYIQRMQGLSDDDVHFVPPPRY